MRATNGATETTGTTGTPGTFITRPECADTPLSKEQAGLDACVHCGFCLQACPTYLALEDENDSPRGRIVLMRALADGVIEARPADSDPGAISLMHKLAAKSRERWPQWAAVDARVGLPEKKAKK